MTNETKREDGPRAGRGLSDAPSGQTIRERLLATVGGMERFAQSFDQRTFSPDRRAAQAIEDAKTNANDGLAALSSEGVSPELAEQWLGGLIARWAKYQHAGARTMNWMITGPARFPVDRNRKRMEVEHARMNEYLDYVNGVREWARRQQRKAERAELVASDEGGHSEKIVNGVRCVLNKTLDRVQLIFPDKPSADERALLKANAFRWAPSVGAWQRQLTQNGVWAAERVLKGIAA